MKRVLPAGSPCVVPFLYVYMTQPHCLLANHSAAEQQLRVEVSCYDLLVKGASDKHVSPGGCSAVTSSPDPPENCHLTVKKLPKT